jgi:hypothetical protein
LDLVLPFLMLIYVSPDNIKYLSRDSLLDHSCDAKIYDHHHTPKEGARAFLFFLYMMLHASLNDGSSPHHTPHTTHTATDHGRTAAAGPDCVISTAQEIMIRRPILNLLALIPRRGAPVKLRKDRKSIPVWHAADRPPFPADIDFASLKLTFPPIYPAEKTTQSGWCPQPETRPDYPFIVCVELFLNNVLNICAG